ncbi:LCP family protein [Rhodococcus sp. BP-349]|uniref:LCP family protein n=1 Tax=unclassified Rhodococcus (in: high G+C Gram-positive bacteria) TaxID=192944 RepID=UPI001C9B88EA|nr:MULTISPECIES: LCP family protein [unclassified Rhodococcus (in: high G+C Gram-positive bacteria)]MBY6539102.1 LCP family protein [Rhodococcus sp. BP-363]MBY6544570.1 LCP family protein [Rhodococcus sp. BP-369]MBY6563800.1 LCP family protein [Rhodococcus sp. BP-370]MBY6578092.1 LCP family protein [Rhodococcus sp. BP-364]MBY6587393.1 LCP family protein [Rhodococcus sp. BP-358]
MSQQPPYDPRRRPPPPRRPGPEEPPVVRRRAGSPPGWADQTRVQRGPQQPPPRQDPRAWSAVPPARDAPRRDDRYRDDRRPYDDGRGPADRGRAPAPAPVPPRQVPPEPTRRRRRPRWGRRIGIALVVLLLLVVGGAVWADTSLSRVDALGNYEGRPGDTPGTNWLLVGSDSRTGLTPEQEAELATGGDIGAGRTDTILLIHVPASGPTTMVSLPRDWYVPIPGNGTDKLNASFSIGGAPLLVQTVEGVTGLRIDHYAEVGFGGFADMVDAIGGVDICVPYDIVDPLAGIDLRAGCQELSGPQALGFVRSRATALADIDRMNNQRLFLSSLLSKATSPTTFLNPFRAVPLVRGVVTSLQVDDGDHIWNLASLGWALRGEMVTTTIPVSGFEDVDGSGNVLLSDRERASRFFELLATDQQLPPDLVGGG